MAKLRETSLMMDSELKSIIGIDIGSAFLSVVQLNLAGEIIKHVYLEHNGKIREVLDSLDSKFDLSSVCAVTTPSGKEWFNDQKSENIGRIYYYDHQTALIQAAEEYIPGGFGSILQVGAGRFQLIMFNENAKYDQTLTSTSCAAGTGSFLDQQAYRLNLNGSSELSRIADDNKYEIPVIASRCAVFAKTDLIHAQQAGYSTSAICDSLCRGLAKNIVD
ncbi:MAG: BadF/BadG/BcrA/BcrD ATPase family protein, partial [Bacteroidota bacterium]|nr:BadF/BadG/BcrA/BcrD ATPase family protein [Bacteroidota bacterium]